MLVYLRGIVEYCLRYIGDGEVKFHMYIDSGWKGSETNRKITLVFFTLGSMMISVSRKRKDFLAFNSIELEYMKMTTTSFEDI
jgi:hypothetical protein